MKKLLLLPAGLFLFFACVPKDQYDALQIERDYYRNKTVEADSLADLRALDTYEVEDNGNAEMDNTLRQLEAVTATNRALNESYQSLVTRYDDLLAQNQKLLTNTGEEVTGLQQTLADRTMEISAKESELRRLEVDLRAREESIARIESDYTPAGGEGPASDRGVVNAGGRPPLSAQQNAALRLNEIQNDLTQLLNYLPPTAYIVAPAGVNRLQVTLAEGLLTSDGFAMSAEGMALLRKLAMTLRQYPNSEITVIGHADGSETDAQLAFEDSTDKAISVVRQFIDFGIMPAKITAAGKGYNAPVADNSTERGRAANRRLEIMIVTPE